MQKILAFCLIVYLTIVPPLAFATSASASMGGWSFSAFDVSTSVVTAIKNGASASVAVAKSPISQKIAKGIVGGAIAGAALPLAISQITGIAMSAVDWVLDPANNTIKYKDKTAPDVITGTKYHFYQDYDNLKLYDTPQAACNISDLVFYYPHMSGFASRPLVWDGTNCILDSSDMDWRAYRIESVVIDTPNDYKTIPIPTIADKIYDNAKTDTASASIVNNAVKEYVNEGSADVALDNAKANTDATHNCGTGTHWSGSACVADTPSTKPSDTPFDLSSILSALQSIYDAIKGLASAIVEPILNAIDLVIQTINDAWHWWIDEWTEFKTKVLDFIDWVRGDFDNSDDVKPDVDKTPPTKSARDFDANYINFGGQCPTFQPVTISVGLVSVPISFNAQPICDFAILCRPAILALAYFAAMAIVANAIRSD